MFDGLQHVWRTTDNGGERAYLDEHCNEISGDFEEPCGDWQPLGGKGRRPVRGDPGNYVVAIERAAEQQRHPVGRHPAGSDLRVDERRRSQTRPRSRYKRYDTKLGLPHRFPSGHRVDPDKPNHAYISYSGYSAYSPGGHVYDVTVDPATGNGHGQGPQRQPR